MFKYVQGEKLYVDPLSLVGDPNNITARERACMSMHFGHYLLDHNVGYPFVQAVLAGRVPPMSEEQLEALRFAAAYAIDDGVAIIAIEGPLTARVSKFGGTSMLRVQEALAHIAKNPEVEGLMLSINSPGGAAHGIEELAQAIREMRADIPVVTHYYGYSFSGGIYVGSQAGTVTASPSCEVGSIGCVVTVDDHSERYKKAGIKPRTVRSVPGKAAVIEGEPVTEEAIADIQEKVNYFHERFVDAVAAGRDMDREVVAGWATGKTWFAEDALEMGLIDDIMSFDESLSLLKESIGKKTKKTVDVRSGGTSVSTHTQPVVGETMNLKKIKAFLLENEEGQALLSELSVSAVDEAIKAKLESGELVAVGELSEESKALLGETFDSESVISLIEGAPDDALVSATAAKAALKRADEIAAENLKGEVKLVGDAHEISALSGGEIPASKVLETVKASKDADMALAQQRTAAENLKLKNTKARVEQTPEEALKADFDEMADKGYFGEIKDDEHRAKLFADFRKRRAKG